MVTWKRRRKRTANPDAAGEIEIRSGNGRRTLTAKNPKGETVFDGPIETDEQRKAVPAGFGRMLEQVEMRARAIRAAGGALPGPTPGEPGGPAPRRNQPEIQ